MGTNCASVLEFSDTKRIDRLETSRQSIAGEIMGRAECGLAPIEMRLHYRSPGDRLADDSRSRSGPAGHDSLGSLYTEHHRHVLQVCRRFFRRPEDAEDAAAEVFLKLYRVLHTKDQDRPFRPWVCQVAGRHCIDKLRERKSETHSLINGVDVHAVADTSAPSVLSRILREEAVREVREELNRLPHYYRVPLILRYYKRMSYFDIARALGRGLPAVKSMIFRAKRRLRRNLRSGSVVRENREPIETMQVD
jgi:RNA polymerase sigma factor (sigma-70 family)